MSLKKFIKRGFQYIVHGVPTNHVVASVVSLSPSELLKGRCALITGGSSGIGYAIAQAFVNAGASVIITGRNEQKLAESCEFLNNSTNRKDVACGFKMDVKSLDDIKTSLKSIYTAISPKKIDILVNNAGVIGEIGIADVQENMFDDVISTNIKGPFFLSAFVGQYMKENGIEGNIINILSSSSLRPANSAYGISKWGMLGFTQGLAKSLAPYGITVNGLAPGPTATPMLAVDKENIYRKGLLGRYILPEEIANVAVILVSSLSKAIIGDTIYMTGGCGLLSNDDIPCKF